MTDDNKLVDHVAAKFAQDCEDSGYEPKKDTTTVAYYNFIQSMMDEGDEPLPRFVTEAYGIETKDKKEDTDD